MNFFCVVIFLVAAVSVVASPLTIKGSVIPSDMRSPQGSTINFLLNMGQNTTEDGMIRFSENIFQNGSSPNINQPVIATFLENQNELTTFGVTADSNDIRHTFWNDLKDNRIEVKFEFVTPTELKCTLKCMDCYAYEEEQLWFFLFDTAFSRTDASIPMSVPASVEREQSKLNQPRRLIIAASALLTLGMSLYSCSSHSGLMHITRLSVLSRSVECNQMLDWLLNPTRQSFGRGRQGPFLAGQLLNLSIFFCIIFLHSTLLHRAPRFFSKYFPGINFLFLIVLLPGIAITSFETLFITGAPMRWALAILMLIAVGGFLSLSFYTVGPHQKLLSWDNDKERFVHFLDKNFIVRWQTLLVPFRGGHSRFHFLVELIATLAICAFSAADPLGTGNNGCFLRVVATIVTIFCESVCLLAFRPFKMKNEFAFVCGFRFTELLISSLSLAATTSSDPANDFVSSCNGFLMLGAGVAVLKAGEEFIVAAHGTSPATPPATAPTEMKENEKENVDQHGLEQPLLHSTNTDISPVRRRIIRILNYQFVANKLDCLEPPQQETCLQENFGNERTTVPVDEPTMPHRRKLVLSMRRRGAHESLSGTLIERCGGDEGKALQRLKEKCAEEPPSPEPTPVDETSTDFDQEVVRRIVRRMNYRCADDLLRRHQSDEPSILEEINSRFGSASTDVSVGLDQRHQIVQELRARQAHESAAFSLINSRKDQNPQKTLQSMSKKWGPEEPPTPSMDEVDRILDDPEYAATVPTVKQEFSVTRSTPAAPVPAQLVEEISIRKDTSVFVVETETFVSPMRVPTRRRLVPPENHSGGEPCSPTPGDGHNLERGKLSQSPDFEEWDCHDTVYPPGYHLL